MDSDSFLYEGKQRKNLSLLLEGKEVMPCFAAHQKKVEAHVESIGDKKIALVINNVKVSEIKPIMDFIQQMRSKKSL